MKYFLVLLVAIYITYPWVLYRAVKYWKVEYVVVKAIVSTKSIVDGLDIKGLRYIQVALYLVDSVVLFVTHPVSLVKIGLPKMLRAYRLENMTKENVDKTVAHVVDILE